MAEILFLPIRPLDSNRSDRLHADLAAAHARGEPLGSRAPYIQASGERLLELSRLFEDAVNALEMTLTGLSLQDPAFSKSLRDFAATARDLAETTQRYPQGA